MRSTNVRGALGLMLGGGCYTPLSAGEALAQDAMFGRTFFFGGTASF